MIPIDIYVNELTGTIGTQSAMQERTRKEPAQGMNTHIQEFFLRRQRGLFFFVTRFHATLGTNKFEEQGVLLGCSGKERRREKKGREGLRCYGSYQNGVWCMRSSGSHNKFVGKILRWLKYYSCHSEGFKSSKLGRWLYVCI